MYSVSPQTPFCQIDSEEEAATSDQVATIIGNADILAWRGLMGIASLHPSYGLRSSRRAIVMMIAPAQRRSEGHPAARCDRRSESRRRRAGQAVR